ncbi:GGDEF domain-containing protein [Mycobacteroides abscessus]|uniref:GGDEF domain-containing protein n=1 Tax=Mycobacteroides abscessus TaxID=36809 RepID=UPI00092CDD82|nr:sensor domain-containing diguanylate cyclase [Mycobacteroides abscessus]SHQ89312.1 Diguanylate cyclase/phosphodiesterase [Mycobacteroides abscessus subsp. bolletii]SHR73652.1 Diguanylate cyclase/phosphodiesterase [Mycobacteroides abscessus subsp. bolletii]SHT16954.1 Diguanylate cyclase/phosphodiesterase [Mycobacteroides abscessus subsp. bolletii]SKG05927.1 Diguanylate cyclase/phosphodiesterase [Mycobacteroides abscessus subsp. bolletii]SKG72708.1 Diguanylate cyclase/phosphodiesterase [Mycob
MSFRAHAERIYTANTDVLQGIRLLRPIWLLTAVCAPGIGAAAITLAFAGMSTAPAVCLAISIPAFGWGIRYASRKPITYAGSIAYIAYCDLAITAGVCVVTETGIAFLKLVWLVAANTYAFAFHGKVAMATQAAVTTLATALTVVGALIRGDSSVPALITTVATVILVNAVAAWAIYAGMAMFAKDAQGKDHLSRHDELTGLLNRRGLQQACEQWAGNATDKHVVVAVIDLNGFKSINDNQGHHAGDEVLRKTAQRLRTLAGPDTWLVRLGGDEFGVITIVDPGSALDYQQVVENALGSNMAEVDASVGIASEALSYMDVEPVSPAAIVAELLVKADTAMYAVKRRSRSQGISLIERRSQENPRTAVIP